MDDSNLGPGTYNPNPLIQRGTIAKKLLISGEN